ncbi:hypothetical protein [uncultured Bifidobacterium sp.]|jgi:hypothetical protein|uniref:hypothetical protein n=1 Tax=uncultured Bifidobacterium sp. TaxID=165187 RepID=UPI002589B8D7|nr:hypothetical protein [uncultured Bifidobacterium sp.]
MNHTTRATAALTAALLAIAPLAGCSGTEREAVDTLTGETTTLAVQEITITLSDTRRVPCIILNPRSKYQAMSCDWAHADGSDLL